jgi:tRNA threonylcarbamoyladenosine biosynthesis protein TsaE
VGEALAALIEPGDLVLLSGEMGAGKTAFVQGLGRGLGVPGRITSPTFTIAHQYAGEQLTMHHLDVYRLEHLNEALDVGLAEMLDEGSLVVIEWGDAIAPVLPRDYLEVRLAFGSRDDDRELVFRPVGRRWLARSRSLGDVLSPWSGSC